MISSLSLHHFEEFTETPFDFQTTATAHGWVALAPFEWNASPQELRRVQRLSSGQVVRLRMRVAAETAPQRVQVAVESSQPLTTAEVAEAAGAVRRMLRLDEDLSDFYRLQQQLGEWQLKLKPGGGRLLRCPTLFEDIVYTLCTTNINWAGTIRMVERLVTKLGEAFPGQPEWRAFPTPEAIVAAGPDFLKAETGLGYRSGYVWELAANVVSGELDLAIFDNPALAVEALHRDLRRLKGVGDYAAATILMLLGRYERLAIDSELRSFASTKYFNGETPTDAQIKELYAPWGAWQYLAYWFDAG